MVSDCLPDRFGIASISPSRGGLISCSLGPILLKKKFSPLKILLLMSSTGLHLLAERSVLTSEKQACNERDFTKLYMGSEEEARFTEPSVIP